MPRDAFKAAGTGQWFTILILSIVFDIPTFIISSLNKKFEGKTIFEYSNILVCKPISVSIGFICTSYFLLVLLVIFRMIAEIIKVSFLVLTPI